jgi:predicted amidohydrolase YtcJ
VLSYNLLTMNPDGIKDVDVVMTLVGGKLVYEK